MLKRTVTAQVLQEEAGLHARARRIAQLRPARLRGTLLHGTVDSGLRSTFTQRRQCQVGMRRAQAIVAQQSQEKGLDEELAASGEALAMWNLLLCSFVAIGLLKYAASAAVMQMMGIEVLVWGLRQCSHFAMIAAGFQSRHQDALDRFNLEASSSESDSGELSDAADSSGSVPAIDPVEALACSRADAGAEAAAGERASARAPLRSRHLQPASSAAIAAEQLASVCRIGSASDDGTDASSSELESDFDDGAAAPQRATAAGPERVEDLVRRKVTTQRQSAVRRGALAHASRNAQKAVSRKGRNDVNASRLLG